MSALELSFQDEAKVKEHLKKQYKDIFLPEDIDNHLQNRVGTHLAAIRFQYVSTFSQPQKLLDIGCGYGAFVLENRKAGVEAYGLEIADFEVEIAEKRAAATLGSSKDKIFTLGSAYELPFPDKSFDVITLWEVIEHIEKLEPVIKEVNRVLKPGGKAFIVCPNYCAFRREAHYQIMWFPLLPRTWAKIYLKLRGRDPSFFEESIFYRTNTETIRCLHRNGFAVSSDYIEKFRDINKVENPKVKKMLGLIERFGFRKVFNLLLKAQMCNPFKNSVNLICTKT